MLTQTQTTTFTLTASDVREVMQLTTQEICSIAAAFPELFAHIDVDGVLVDCSLFVLNSVIASLEVEFFLNGEVVRAYRYLVSDSGLTAFGPSASEPPIGFLPPGTQVRIAVSSNPEQTSEYCNAWFNRLGWQTVEQLRIPDGVQYQAYGAFVSGRFGVERQLLVNPRFDQPVSTSHQTQWSR
jgi:hypothetical protein